MISLLRKIRNRFPRFSSAGFFIYCKINFLKLCMTPGISGQGNPSGSQLSASLCFYQKRCSDKAHRCETCSKLYEIGVMMSSSGGTQLNWGNRWGWEREWGGQSASNLGPGWTRIALRKVEGFQVRKGTQGKRECREESARGIDKGNQQGIMPWLSIVDLCTCICIIILCEWS
jgi:hypothetical protein